MEYILYITYYIIVLFPKKVRVIKSETYIYLSAIVSFKEICELKLAFYHVDDTRKFKSPLEIINLKEPKKLN